jgi:DNA polymerase III sliding clamp (beta) subunit (PCNA family)
MFDGSELTMVSALGARVAMVEWAAASDGIPPLCGVYLDGTYAIATDRYKLIRIPCKIDLPRPVLIPSGILGQALKTMGETGVGLSGTQFLLAPDDYTQLRTVIYDAQYVPANLIFATEYEAVVEVDKAEMLDKIGRACNYAGAERNPVLKTFWGKGSIVVMMEDAEVGLFGDVIECPSQLQHDRIEIMFSPKYLTDTLSHAPDPKVKISYDFSHNNTPHVRIDGGSGYFGWVMKRKDSRPTV